MHSKTKRSKVHPLERKADESSDRSKWVMKFRLVEIMSTVLDVDETPRRNTAPRLKYLFGKENTANQSLELKDTGKGNMTLSLTVGGHVR
eukprot:3919076-Heterocapsa_arctica.AAC.1